MRKCSMILIALASVALLFGAGKKGGEGLRVAFIPQVAGIPYFSAMEKGGERAAKELGGQFLYRGSTTAAIQEQARIVESLIAQKVDVISLAVLDPAINPLLQKAQDAGIHVVTADADSPESCRELFVSQADEVDLGFTLADNLAKQLGGQGELAFVAASSTSLHLKAWIGHIRERIADRYPGMREVDIRYAPGGTEDAFKQAQELMSRFPNLKAIIGVASSDVPGVARAVQQAGKTGKVKVIGYASPNTIRPYIHNGVMEASILWDPEALGYLTFWASKQLAEGVPFQESNKVPGFEQPVRYFPETKTLLLGDPLVITKDNVDDFDF